MTDFIDLERELGPDDERRGLGDESRRATAIVVAGMHRSGTSALTRVLNLLGLDLPAGMYPAGDDNPLGFWEPLAVVEAHEEFLASIGSSHDDMSALPDSVFTTAGAHAFENRLVGLLEQEYGGSRGFVVKDPRICRLLPIWCSALERFGAEPHFVLPVRNPLEVASSLKERNGYSTTKSLLLWLRHVLEAERHTRSRPRSVVAYEDLLRDWRSSVDRVAFELGVAWPRSSHVAYAEIETFLSPRRRHHTFAAHEVAVRPDVGEWIKRTYAALSSAAGGEPLDVQQLDAVRGELDRADSVFGPLLAESSIEIVARDRDMAAVTAARADLEARLSERDVELERLGLERENWRRSTGEYEQDRDRWRERAGDAEKERASLSEQLEAAVAAAAAAEAQRDVWERAADQARAAAEELETRVRAELQQLALDRDSWRTRAGEYEHDLDRWRERAGDAEKERASLSEQLEAAVAAAAAAEAQRDVWERAADQARAAAEELETRVRAELQQLALDRDSWRTRAGEYEHDLDRWRERAGDAEKERASLSEQLEAAVAAAAAAEAQRDVWERAADQARAAAEELETRVRAELQQLALDRDNWRRGASEYEQDRDRWRERAGSAEQEQASLNQQLEAALAAAAAARAPGGWVRKWRAFSQFGSWLARGRLGYVHQFFVLRRSFDDEAYLALNSDVVATGLHPLLHYIEHGAREGRALQSESPPPPAPAAATPEEAHAAVPDAAATPEAIAAFLERSGLIDADFYRQEYPEVESSELTPEQHYCWLGWREGRRPNAYFDVEWYLKTYPDVAREARNPLWDYVVTRETRRPCAYFDPAFYANRYGLPSTDGALANFLQHRKRGEWRDPVELFDTQFYLAHNQDVAASGGDPFLHYLSTGHREARNPSPGFSTVEYCSQHLQGRPDVNPLLHHYETLLQAPSDAAPAPSPQLPTPADEVHRMVRPGPEFEEFDPQIASGAPPRAKAIAFFLPQFHAIPENDEWWGKGFTEWSNVVRGCPRYVGHYQPRLPRDLGFYDLTRAETLSRQVDLARAAGIHGFSFYYYWFDGKRLLERPLERFLEDPAIDFPFCVTWANENWTRRWDGLDDEILIAQSYDPSYDVALVDDLQRHFVDPRYIRLQGRPLLLLYRVDCIPDAARRIERWRELWESRHDEEPLIFVAQAFGSADPHLFGLDGAFEVPPHKVVEGLPPINSQLTVIDSTFRGHVVAYDDVVAESLGEPAPAYPLMKTAVPAWDNEARRQGAGLTLHGSTPATYERWLRTLADAAMRRPVFGESLVFVNAWNEWAEAAYLEPDVHYGAAYLNATARALCDPRPAAKRKVLFVGHDAHRHGAQINVWHMADTLKNQFGCEVAYLLLAGGAMVPEYEQLGRVWVADGDPVRIAAAVAELRRDGFELAVTNTTLSGAAVPHLKAVGFRVVSLIHELPGIIGELAAEESLAAILEQADTVVVPAHTVAHAIDPGASADVRERIVVRPQGLYKEFDQPTDARVRLRHRLGMPDGSRVVLNVGFGDFRKGVDTFFHVAKLAASRADDLHFVWVGNIHGDAERWLTRDVGGALRDRIHLVPYTDDVAEFYFGADVFFLSSREDPFPSVVLEAMTAGLPVVGLRGAGGTDDLIAEYGRLVDRDDVVGVAVALDEASREGDERARAARARLVAEQFRFDDYCFDLLRLLEPDLEKVSVVVPNYNYARYLDGRMRSIFDQTYPVFETLVLDDCSTDDSLARIDEIARARGRRVRLISNEENSGSPFAQWERGCRLARGKYVWVAEADDESDPRFLEEVVTRQRRDGASFAFSDSVPIDKDGATLASSYKAYYRESVGNLMDSSFVLDGKSFLERCLGERNLVLNASAVVWEREALLDALASSRDTLQEYRMAGDWHLYAAAALSAKRVAYLSPPLNVHRRHDSSVTATLNGHEHIEEVERVQGFIAKALGGGGEGIRLRMRGYADHLRRQLGVKIDSEPRE